MYFKIENLPEQLREQGLQAGDELIVVTSSKPKVSEFSKVAEKYFKGELLFDKDRTYMGFIGTKNSAVSKE